MEYQKKCNLLENTPDQPCKFKTKNWLETMMVQVEHIILIVELNSKLKC